MKVGDSIKLKATKSASNRTKNRIREHGHSSFEVCRQPQHVISMSTTAVLLKTDRWFGWLPLNEIEVIDDN
jgi:hypothetical protein